MARPMTNQKAQAAQASDTDFQDIWGYLKWLRRGYDVGARATGNPTVGDYIDKAWDWGKENFASTGAEAGSGAGGEYMAGADTMYGGAGAGATNVMGTPLAEQGLAGVGWGGAASLVAPLLMTYHAYTAGSGRNEPIEKRMESLGAVPLMKNIAEGQDVKPDDLWAKYRQQPRYLPGAEGGPGDVVDPNYKPTLEDLYHGMHYRGKGHKQSTGDSGLTDSQIDEMILDAGVSQEDLLKALRMNNLPDWSKYSYDTWYTDVYGPYLNKLFRNDPNYAEMQYMGGGNPNVKLIPDETVGFL